MKIRWTRNARADIDNLRRYIAQDSPYYAQQFTERLLASVEKLADFPQIGRRVPEAEQRDDIRELLFRNYRIIYLAQKRQVQILTVIHGNRNLEVLDPKPWDER